MLRHVPYYGILLSDYREAKRKNKAAEIALNSAKAAYEAYCGVMEDELNALYILSMLPGTSPTSSAQLLRSALTAITNLVSFYLAF
jgi:hypothetical protein